MYTIIAKTEEVCNELPKVKKWIKNIHSKILKTDVDMSKIDISYSYGFFVTKVKNEKYNQQHTLKFDDRLKLEMSKLRIDIFIEIGKFSMANRLSDKIIPTSIKNIVTELTKVKMLLESNYHKNKEVIESIPEIDTSIISYRIIYEGDESEEEKFDMDSILDKINRLGIESLNEEERTFLDNISKGF